MCNYFSFFCFIEKPIVSIYVLQYFVWLLQILPVEGMQAKLTSLYYLGVLAAVSDGADDKEVKKTKSCCLVSTKWETLMVAKWKGKAGRQIN